MYTRWLSIAAAAAMVMGSAGALSRADAATLSFFNITNNGNANLAGQLGAQVTDPGGGQISFAFSNNVGIASSITDIYFDAGGFLGGIASLIESGVDFGIGASPPNVPGGNSITPVFVTSASADSEPPVSQNGINSSSDLLTIILNLAGGKTFSDVLAALTSGDVRVGLHVQAIGAREGSDSYVNNPPGGGGGGPSPVPLPAAVYLFGTAVVGLVALGRRRRAA